MKDSRKNTECEDGKRRRKAAAVPEHLVCMLGYVYIALLLLCFIPTVLGYQEYVVISGSMEPKIPVGSCVLVKKTSEEKITEGDVITYFLQDSDTVVTHRVIEHNTLSNSFRTKGDANDYADAKQVLYSQVLGKVCFCMPLLGYFLTVQNIPGVKVCGTALILMVVFLKKQQDDKRRSDKQKCDEKCSEG